MKARANMSLAELARGVPGVKLIGDGAVTVGGITYDSRKAGPGDLFVAVPGTRQDGAGFVPQALAAGAAAVLSTDERAAGKAPAIIAADVRLAMGRLAARLAGFPDRRMTVIGITGTNGKTTITYILEAVLAQAGLKPGVIGTVNHRYGGRIRPANTTTPESVDIFEMMMEMENTGVTHAIMEVSSHALDQKRVSGLTVRSAAFTNLTRDHLDYHRDMEEYYAAKKKLFTEVMAGAWTEEGRADGEAAAAVNLDDEYGLRLFNELAGKKVRVIGYGIKAERAEVRALAVKLSARGLSARVVTPEGTSEVSSRLVGGHNVENILAAWALAASLGIAPQTIAEGIAGLTRVPGRLEPVENGAGITVLVDYAHTPDALEHAVKACRSLAPKRLITVFGCGGDRDAGKRPIMGRIAVAGSDLAVITSDNPRTEDPERIIASIVAGARETRAKMLDARELAAGANGLIGYAVEPDRKSAIRLAVAAAKKGDMVLIAGKGHEDYQILGTSKIHFDDREEAGEALKERGEK
ncbi:MAG TPA: UDP-N-acetylmuramoyl-L-alanyl-D-glutamate--2,6-diaminopimelate ligase [bacterium]|nr:UDP-N-acetylmuramoyl-L-alanyl-D-glutamate--2,6-diaminopimelate ligase [bacterium]